MQILTPLEKKKWFKHCRDLWDNPAIPINLEIGTETENVDCVKMIRLQEVLKMTNIKKL